MTEQHIQGWILVAVAIFIAIAIVNVEYQVWKDKRKK